MCRSGGNRRGRLRGVSVLLALSLISPARAEEAACADPAARALFLEVFVNGAPMQLIAEFREGVDGTLCAEAEELRGSGILPDPVARTGLVPLDALPGLDWTLDEAAQTIRFEAAAAARAPRALSARAPVPLAQEDGPPAVDTGVGLVLNYLLDLETYGGDGAAGESQSGSFDARLFTPFGAVSHGFALTGGTGEALRYRRLETYWRSAFPGRAAQLQFGDITSRGPGWSRAVRLGGVMIERNFALRPDLVTLPLPSYSGSAEVPSTVEVYSGSIRTYAADVPAGPFSISDLPLPTGSGLATVVLRDVTGHEVQVALPFLVADELLRRGTLDYALALGRPRLGIGTEDDRYGEAQYGVASLRYGLSDAVTLQFHGEAGEGLQLAGLGATFRLGTRGTAAVTVADSRTATDHGRLAEVSGRVHLGRVQLSGRAQRSWGQFDDIASVSAEAPAAGPPGSAPLRHLGQVALSVPLTVAGGASMSLFAADLGRTDGSAERSLGLSYSRPLFAEGSLNLSAYSVQGDGADAVVGLGLSLPFGRRGTAGATVESRGGAARSSLSASGRSGLREEGWDWRGQLGRSDDGGLADARLAHTGRLGRAEVALRRYGESSGAGLRLEGALVAAGGGLFLSRRIDDAFAVVDAGAPGVAVEAENRAVGRTGPGGRLLVPDLRSYERNTLAIDTASLPLDAVTGETRRIVRPAYRNGVTVDFGVETEAHGALVGLVDAAGAALPVGGAALVNGTGEPILVGYDGLVYALGLGAANEIAVSYPDGHSCRAQFPYVDTPGTIPEIRGVLCQ